MLLPPPEAAGVMDVQCLSLQVSVLQAGCVYFGWEEERDRDMKLGSCLEITLCLLAVTSLTFKKNILFLLTKFVSWTICQSRRKVKRACLLMELFRNS